MLKRWSIENFKSFAGRTDISLAPITVFAGANSSGKSTIIQSMLLLKQTIQYAPISRPMALNGPLLKLGTFNDIKNSSSTESHVGVGWEMETEDLTQQYYRPYSDFTGWSSFPFYHFGRSGIKSVSGEFTWDVTPVTQADYPLNPAGPELLQLYPRLASCALSGLMSDPDLEPFSIVLDRQVKAESEKRTFDFHVAEIDSRSKAEVFGTKPEAEIVGAGARHFFPAQIGIRFNATRNRARIIASIICGEDTFIWQARELLKAEIPSSLVREIMQVLTGETSDLPLNRELFPEIVKETQTAEEIADRFRRYRIRSRSLNVEAKQTTRTLSELRYEIESLLVRDEVPKFAIEPTISAPLAEGSQYATQYFISALRYLGPLRDEPKPIYPLEALANPTEVGFKGEHTAAVLDLNRDRRIRYLPSSFIEGDRLDTNLKYATLHDAVVDWLTYVGVASEVTTSDQGKVGHQLQVQTEGQSRFHDLTNVGVGVSQVLPIIVMALLAEPPTLLIFEQPELHLHPKVQARLADFFLSVALIGKQCLLETHSEYLIDRFRHRVAAATGDSLTSVLKIYFTERTHGTTECREVEVSKYGAIASWPKDFFEQSQIETESILRAASAKRLAEKRK